MTQMVFAVALMAHGVGHVMGFLATWTSLPQEFTVKSWVMSQSIGLKSPIARLFGLLWLAAMFLSIQAGIGLLMNVNWWASVALLAAGLSLLVMGAWWQTITPSSRTWATLFNLLILVVAFQSF